MQDTGTESAACFEPAIQLPTAPARNIGSPLTDLPAPISGRTKMTGESKMAVHRGNRWTSEDDGLLEKLIKDKTPPLVISVRMKRSLEAIRMRLIELRKKATVKG